MRSRGPPTTNTDRHHHPSNPPAAPQQQTNNSLNFKQLLHKAAASQQHVADTNWQLTCTHTLCRDSNFLYKTNPISMRAARSCAPRESHVPASKKKSGGTSDCRASVVQPESNRCQSAHQNNILCHLPLPVAMSSRRSRTKIPPPRTLHDQFASPRHSGRWGAPDSRRRRLCRGEHACELPAARAEGAASVSVHRRPTPNRCQGHRANVRSEPTTEQSAGRCAQHFTTKVRAMQLAAFSANQAWCQPIRAIVIFAL